MRIESSAKQKAVTLRRQAASTDRRPCVICGRLCSWRVGDIYGASCLSRINTCSQVCQERLIQSKKTKEKSK